MIPGGHLLPDYRNLTESEKKQMLFQKQKQMLDAFLERHAITRAQYDKSLGDLIEKMDIRES